MKRVLQNDEMPDKIQLKIVNYLKSEIYTLNYDLDSMDCWKNLANILSVESDTERAYTWIELKKYYINTLIYYLGHPKYHLTYDEKIRLIYPFLLSYYQIYVQFIRTKIGTIIKLPSKIIEIHRALIQHTVSKKFNKNLYKIISQINGTSEEIIFQINLSNQIIDQYQIDDALKHQIRSIIFQDDPQFENDEQQQETLHIVEKSYLPEIEIENSNSNGSIETQPFIGSPLSVTTKHKSIVSSSSSSSNRPVTSSALPLPLQQETNDCDKHKHTKISGIENSNSNSSIEITPFIKSSSPIITTKRKSIVSSSTSLNHSVTSVALQQETNDCDKNTHQQNSGIENSHSNGSISPVIRSSSPIITTKRKSIVSSSSSSAAASSRASTFSPLPLTLPKEITLSSTSSKPSSLPTSPVLCIPSDSHSSILADLMEFNSELNAKRIANEHVFKVINSMFRDFPS